MSDKEEMKYREMLTKENLNLFDYYSNINELKISSRKKYIMKYILDNFDFHKAHKCMVLMDWKWANISCFDIPTRKDIIKCAYDLLTKLMLYTEENNKIYYIASGGLEVIYYGEDIYDLKFVLTSWAFDYYTKDGDKIYNRLLKIENIEKAIK